MLGHSLQWGVPEDADTHMCRKLEELMESDRSCALLYYRKGDLNKKRTSEQMRDYCIMNNKLCRKVAISSDFDGCEDVHVSYICRKECTCDSCLSVKSMSDFFSLGCIFRYRRPLSSQSCYTA